MDITNWLDGLSLGKYAGAFAANGVDADVLPKLTAEDLREIGVDKIGDRRKLLDAIAALSSPPAPAPAPPPAPPPAATAQRDGEKREVAILFADLSGSTALAAELGPEAMHALLETYFEALDAIVDSYGGHVDKHIGDAVMGVFGAPVAHGNDIERAVRAALDILKAMASLSMTAGRPLKAHVAVAAGGVVASSTGSATHSEYTVIGDAVNLCARLLEKAAPDEVLISDAVLRGLGARARVEDLGAVAFKGLPKPERVYRLLALAEAAARPKIVGRRAELGIFSASLAACRELARGQVVYLRGEAGIGKTRLIAAALDAAAAQGFSVHFAKARDFGSSAERDPILALARSLLSLGPADGADAAARAARKALARGLLSEAEAAFLCDLLGLSPAPGQRAFFEAMEPEVREAKKRRTLAGLIQNLAAKAPLMIAIEDLFLCDKLSLARIGELAAVVVDSPTLLALSSRIEGDPLDGALKSQLRQATLTIIELGPLPVPEAKALVRAEGLSEAEANALVERAGGHPLFLEQLVMGVRDTGLAELPPTAKSVILARLDTLDPFDRKAIKAASVLGQRFPLAALRHLLGAPAYDVAPLVEKHLLEPEGDGLAFAHALVREGIAASLLGKRKKELHLLAAEWFSGRDPLVYADHLAAAGDDRAALAYLAAAQKEAAAYRDQRALEIAERGAALARTRADIHGLTSLKGELLYALWRIPEARAAHQAALAAADADADRAKALLGIAECDRIEDRLSEALIVLNEAEALARKEGRNDLLARIASLRGNLYFALGEIEPCLHAHEAAAEFARRAGSAELEAKAAGGLGDAEYARGRFLTANRHFRQCVALARAHGLLRIEAANFPMVAYTNFVKGNMTEVVADSRAAMALAQKVGHRRATLIARGSLFLGLFEVGDLEAAKAVAEDLLLEAQRLGAPRFEGQALVLLGQVLVTAGRKALAKETFEKALASTEQISPRAFGPAVLAGLAAATDDAAERRRLLAEGEALLGTALSHNVGFFYRTAIDDALSRGLFDEAERFAGELERLSSIEPYPWVDFLVARGRALSAFGRGQRSAEALEALKAVARTADLFEARLAGLAVHDALDALTKAADRRPLGPGEPPIAPNPPPDRRARSARAVRPE